MFASSSTLSPAATIARILGRSWRESECPVEVSFPEVEAALPLLYATGAAGLIRQRLSQSQLPVERTKELQRVVRQQTIAAMIQEHSVQDIFERMRSRGLEPVLFKGWSLARLYPDAAMRPSGDIDLWVSADQLAEACRTIPTDGSQSYCVPGLAEGVGGHRHAAGAHLRFFSSPGIARAAGIHLFPILRWTG